MQTLRTTSGAGWVGQLAEAGRARATRAVFIAVGVAVAYYVGARIGFALTAAPTPVSTLWPPNAILLAALLLSPPRWWAGILLAAFPAHLAVELGSGVPLSMVLSWFVSNSAEALIGAVGVRRFTDRPTQLDSFRQVGVFVVFAAMLAPFLSSFLDAAFVQWNGWGTDSYWQVWSARFFSNVLTILTLVPAIVTWAARDLESLPSVSPRRVLEATALAGGLLLVCTVVFSQPGLAARESPALLYAPLPFLLWAAVRFGPGGASAALLVFSLLSTWGAIHGRGPFVSRSTSDNVLSLQLFLIVTYIPLLALAAAIRERAQAMSDARRTGEWLNLALGAAQVGAWDWDLLEGSRTWSENMPVLFGLRRDENGKIERSSVLETIVPDDRPIVQAAVTQAVEHAKPYEVEFRTARPDGTVRWMLSKGTVVRDQAGRPRRMLGVSTDITARKDAEAALRSESALRESEARLRVLADAMPQIVFTAKPDGTVDYINRKWHELTGSPPGDVSPDTWLAAIHPNDRAAGTESWLASVQAGRPYENEARIWSAGAGTYRWHLARALPVRDESGAIIHWYGTATDIDDHKRGEQALRESEWNLRVLRSELETHVAKRTMELSRANSTLRQEVEVRRRVEQALRSSEERFSKAFRASLDAISIVSQPDSRILELNDRWEAMFGYSREHAIGRTIDHLNIYANERDREAIADLMRTRGYVHEYELDMRHRTSTPLRAVLAAETVEVAGEPCVIIMVRDITERQRAEREIAVQRSELAHLGRVALLGELSGALAHELNQPLAAILANARAAQRMLARENLDVPEFQAILEDIVSDDRRAGAVIQRVRALIKKDETELHKVSPNDVVADVLELAHSDLIQRAVVVSTRLAPSLPEVQGDRVQLQQVLLNLIVNACDAMVDNPPSLRTLVITTSERGGAVRISISDSGTGITTQPIDAVFQPFVTSKRHGLGLGLAICRSIVDAHGGRLWAVNHRGSGATFHVLLPGATTAPVMAPDVAQAAAIPPV
ncbi:MAG TPA: PAS domain S-box protein [Gemmatimonadaceae bacterium]|nr:PAS domain S-box protein [Gemmatimonadaceae bacterium]